MIQIKNTNVNLCMNEKTFNDSLIKKGSAESILDSLGKVLMQNTGKQKIEKHKKTIQTVN